MPSAYLHPFSPPRADDFVEITGGEGAIVWDDDGNRYVDGMASLWYVNVGYGREEIAEAVAAQIRALGAYHTFHPFTTGPTEALAERIVALSPFDDARVFMGTSGSEAVDTAMKLARIAQREAGHPERHIVVSRERGYHGTNFGGTSLQGIPSNREGWGPLVGGTVVVAADDPGAMDAVFAEHGGEIAAVVTEPVQGAGGVWPPADGYLQHVRDLCNRHGAFLVHDEVITGFGRLGAWFGSEHFGVVPDMITFAKAVTSGYVPLSGVIVGPAVAAALEANEGFLLRTGYTYSGHPVACAAGLEALAITEREGLIDRVPGIGARLSAGLFALRDEGLLSDVRGVGAVWGISVPEGESAAAVRNGMLEHGVIARPIGSSHLSFCPPLVITDDQIDQIVEALGIVLRG